MASALPDFGDKEAMKSEVFTFSCSSNLTNFSLAGASRIVGFALLFSLGNGDSKLLCSSFKFELILSSFSIFCPEKVTFNPLFCDLFDLKDPFFDLIFYPPDLFSFQAENFLGTGTRQNSS